MFSGFTRTSRRLAVTGTVVGLLCVSWGLHLGAAGQTISRDIVAGPADSLRNRQLMLLHNTTDLAIALSYLAIAVTLTVLYVRERRRAPFASIFVAFSVFLFASGLTYAMAVVVLRWPLYWLAADLKLLTALGAITTALTLPELLRPTHKLIQDALSARKNERRFLAASDSSYDAFFILESERDASGQIVDFRFSFVNVNGARMLSSTPQRLRGQLLCELYPVNRTGGFFESYKRVVETGESVQAEFCLEEARIKATWLRHQVVKLEDGVAITTTDIAAFKENERRLIYAAQHDALTGLAERGLIEERLRDALEAGAARPGRCVGLLMVDCDNFKRANDLLGHQAGDKILVEFAQRLRSLARGEDTVARVGGDEFMVVLPEVEGEQQALLIAQQMLAALEQPMTVEGHAVIMTASIGLCVYPGLCLGGPVDAPHDSAAALLKNADAAMYQAKADGRNRVQLFTPEMAGSLARHRLLDATLQHALEAGEFRLVYQPRVDLLTGMVTGVEALLRWHSAELGLVMPAEFIPIAEENGLIVPIGSWVLDRACAEILELEALLGRRVPLAVNVSPRQLQEETLAAQIAASLDRHRMSPVDLELEITENLLLRESPFARANFERVRGLGVRIAIDDFGTGYSSMAYLTRFGVDRLKIDQSFVRRMHHDPESRAICQAIVGLAHALKTCVVAEGVESAGQRDLLRALGCDEAQGNLYTLPVPLRELPAVLRSIEFEVVTAAAA